MSEDIEKKRLSIHVSLRQHQMWREAATREGFVTLTKYIRHVVTNPSHVSLRQHQMWIDNLFFSCSGEYQNASEDRWPQSEYDCHAALDPCQASAPRNGLAGADEYVR